MAMTGLARPRRGRWIAGVCAALARRFDVSPLLVRVVFVVSTIIPGPQFAVYIVLWILIPNED